MQKVAYVRVWPTLLSLVRASVLGTVLAGGAGHLGATYGETRDISGHSVVPAGWVVIRAVGPIQLCGGGIQSSKPNLGALTLTIQDVRGAVPGTRMTVWGHSPIPAGWVILETRWPMTASTGIQQSPSDFSAVSTIERLD